MCQREQISITIPEKESLDGYDMFKNNLHGRMIWPKGAISLKVEELRAKLQVLWKTIAQEPFCFISNIN